MKLSTELQLLRNQIACLTFEDRSPKTELVLHVGMLARQAALLEEQVKAISVEASAFDQTTIDVPMVTALARQILSGRVRKIRWAAIETMAGVALSLAAQLDAKAVQA